MKPSTKRNWKVILSLPKLVGKNVWDTSTNRLKAVWRIVKRLPSAGIDVIQLAKNLSDTDIDDSLSELVDIIRKVELPKEIFGTIGQNIEDVVGNYKELFNELKDIRRQNIQEEEANKMKDKSAKKSYSSNSTKSVGTVRDTVNRKGTNHPEWYMRDKSMLGQLVGINISNRNNTRNGVMKRFLTNSTGAIQSTANIGIPSACGVQMELTIPKSVTEDWRQGINMLYKNIRAANAGAINYSPGQLADYVLTIRSVDAALSSLGRVISLLNSGSFYDAISPQAFFYAMGIDYDSFAANSANARELYNRLSAIRYRLMPLNISLLDRTRWLFSNVFKDSDDAKGQVYIPYFNKIYYFGSNGDPETIILGVQQGSNPNSDVTGIEYGAFESEILKLFNLYQLDSVFQIIAGDILKAYGKEAVNKYPEIYSDTTLKPVYDIHVLTQIQNASLSMTGVLSPDFNTVSYNNGGDIWVVENLNELGTTTTLEKQGVRPDNLTAWDTYIVNPIYNSNTDVVDEGKLLSSTALMVSRHGTVATDTSNAQIIYDTYGTEVVEAMYVVYTDDYAAENYPYGLQSLQITLGSVQVLLRNNEFATYYQDLPAWTWFDYFPVVIPLVVDVAASGNTVYYYLPAFDFNNYGIAYKQNLDSYNAIRTLSMLHKSFITKVNKTEVIEV